MSGGVFGSVIEAAVPDEEVQALDREVARLAHGRGGVMLRIGGALNKLVTAGGHRTDLGFKHLATYAPERCGRSGRWAAEARTLAKRLAELPVIRAAYRAGLINKCMAEVLARYATPETEEALLLRARRTTVRAMREALKQAGKPEGAAPSTDHDEDEAEQERRVTLRRMVTKEQHGLLEATRIAVEETMGYSRGADWVEWLLAEGTASMCNVGKDGVEVEHAEVTKAHAEWRQRCERFEEMRRRAEQRAEKAILDQREVLAAAAEQEEELPDDPYALDEIVRQGCMELAGRELYLGRMLEKLLVMQGPRRLGYANETQYARERLGLSRSAMRGWIQLARKTRGLQQVRDAVADGDISYEMGRLIARVAQPETEAMWIERAKRRTFKHLREEVQAVEMVARVTGDKRALVPPSEEELEHIQDFERDVLTGALLKRALKKLRDAGIEVRVQMSATDGEDDGDGESDGADAGDEEDAEMALSEAFVRMFATPGWERSGVDPETERLGMVPWQVRVPDDVAEHFRHLEVAHEKAGLPGDFLVYLCIEFWTTWAPHFGTKMKWGEIYARDLFRCMTPVCDEKNLTLHHIKFRSAGGTHDPENTATKGDFCHLEAIHKYHSIRMYPPASRPTWIFGRRKTLFVVEGREKREKREKRAAS